MSDQVSLFSEVELSERAARAIDRVKEVFGVAKLPPSFETLARSENGINDVYMNLNRQIADGKLEKKVKLLIAVAVASVSGNKEAVEFFTDAAIAAGRTQKDAAEAVAAATTCTIFNGYYRFKHQVAEADRETFNAFKAPFNANVFVKPALSVLENEAICIAVSSINGCHFCVEGHIEKGRSVGLTNEQIDEIIKASSVAFAAAQISRSLA